MRIKSLIRLLPFTALVIFITSCQKEISADTLGNSGNGNGNGGNGGNNTNNIQGDYDFVGMVAHTNSVVTASQLGQTLKSVTTSDYVTENNAGTVKINANQFITTNMAFDIDTLMHNTTYINGVSQGTIDMPFVQTYPPTSSTASYVRNSADSITVTGTFGPSPDPSGNPPTRPTGIKLSWHSDTLYCKVVATVSQNINQGGIPATLVGSVNGTMKLKKH